MATILDLFKSRKSELYGGTGPELFIDSKGVVNIPRQSALLVTSPGGVTGFIGNQVGGLLKGSAERPTDTIFGSNKPFSRTISLAPGAITGVKYAADGTLGDKKFYVKKDPGIPADSVIAGIQQGATTPGSFIQQQAAKAIKSGGVNKITKDIKSAGGINKAIKNLIKRGELDTTIETYNPGLMEDHKTGKVVAAKKTFSEYAPKYKYDDATGEYKQSGTVKRNGQTTFSTVLEKILKNKYATEEEFKNFETDTKTAQTPFVLFEVYKKGTRILLPGTVSGISEDITPEWSNFKYLGSPFNLYRYNGVERSIKFNLKLYYTDTDSKKAMLTNIDNLKKLVFPDEELAAITYPNKPNSNEQKIYGQLAVKPNLVYVTISALYKKMLGIIDSLSFSIDDNIPWPSDIASETNNEDPYPSVIDVSVSMKIIESLQIKSGNGDVKMFDYSNNYFNNMTSVYNKQKEKAS